MDVLSTQGFILIPKSFIDIKGVNFEKDFFFIFLCVD